MISVILRLLLWVFGVIAMVSVGVFAYNHLPDTVRNISAFVLIVTATAAGIWAIFSALE